MHTCFSFFCNRSLPLNQFTKVFLDRKNDHTMSNHSETKENQSNLFFFQISYSPLVLFTTLHCLFVAWPLYIPSYSARYMCNFYDDHTKLGNKLKVKRELNQQEKLLFQIPILIHILRILIAVINWSVMLFMQIFAMIHICQISTFDCILEHFKCNLLIHL